MAAAGSATAAADDYYCGRRRRFQWAAAALATAAAVEATVQTAVGMVEAVAMVAVTASGAGSYPVDYECRPRMSVLDAAAVVLEPGRRLVATLFQR